MEKLSIEEKAERYDEAIKEATIAHKDEDRHLKSTIERIFPELKEDEDELAWLKNYISEEAYYLSMDIRDDVDRIKLKKLQKSLAWLEKQSERKSTDKIQIGKEYKCIASPRYSMFMTGKIYKPEDKFLCDFMNFCSDCFEPIEDSEQIDLTSNTVNVEPKFKIGDKIIEKDFDECDCGTIIDIKDGKYIFGDGSFIWIKEQGLWELVEKTEPKFKVGDIVQYITDSTDRRKIEEVDTLCNMYHTDSSPIMFEIEDEWKVVVNAEDVELNLTDEGIKAEPNLKVGDWIVKKDGKNFYDGRNFAQITKIDRSMCQFDNSRWLYDYEIRTWSIQDAQDGDLIYVSTEEKSIHAIFDTFDNGIIYFHCYLCGDFTQGGYMPMGDVELVSPLPKTHYQRFFQKMKEAGYEWDAEKKELKKI